MQIQRDTRGSAHRTAASPNAIPPSDTRLSRKVFQPVLASPLCISQTNYTGGNSRHQTINNIMPELRARRSTPTHRSALPCAFLSTLNKPTTYLHHPLQGDTSPENLPLLEPWMELRSLRSCRWGSWQGSPCVPGTVPTEAQEHCRVECKEEGAM